MKIQTDKGLIRVGSEVFTNITGAVATSCYGVKGMAVRSKTDGLVHLLRRESMSKGVRIINHEDGAVTIELHIIVDNGVNLMAVSRSMGRQVCPPSVRAQLSVYLSPALTRKGESTPKPTFWAIWSAVRKPMPSTSSMS